MNVVKITLNGIDYVLSRDSSYSIREYCKKAGIEVLKGSIPDGQQNLCLKLPHFVEIVNGGRARCTRFDFTPGEWEEVAPIQGRTFRNAQERAIAIRAFIKETLQTKGSISSHEILGIFGGLSIGTIRRHLRDTIAVEGLSVDRESSDVYRLIR